MTLPTARAGGFSHPAIRKTSYLPGVLGNYWEPRSPETRRIKELSRMTANVLRWDSLLPATPRTFGCKEHWAKPTKPGFIAQANMQSIACALPIGKGPFIPCLRRLPAGVLWPHDG